MSDVAKTLEERGSRYGSFADNAKITQALMDMLTYAPNYEQLSAQHLEAFHMIFHKISRMACGDCMYSDSAHDIAGYAKLLEEWIDAQ
jgi:peptidase E